MSKKLFSLFFLVIAIVNINFSQEKKLQQYSYNKAFEVNRFAKPKSTLNINALKSLIFSYSYNAVMTELDTIMDSKIRKRIDELVLATVKYALPNIEILNDTITNQDKDFYSMIKTFGLINPHRNKLNSKKIKKTIPELSSPYTNKNQMIFMNIFYEETNTSIFSLYILNPLKLELLYYDRINTKYDARDESSVVKSIHYLLNTFIIENSESLTHNSASQIQE